MATEMANMDGENGTGQLAQPDMNKMEVASVSGVLDEELLPNDDRRDSVDDNDIIATNGAGDDNDDLPPEDKYKNLVDTVVSRNWFLLFQFAMLGAFIGIIIYIISGNADYIWYMGGTFAALAFGIDFITPKDYKTTKVWTDHILRHQHEPDWDANDNEDVEFPLRSEFYDYNGALAGVTMLYQVGQSPAQRLRGGGKKGGRNSNNIDDDFEEELKVGGLEYGMSNAAKRNGGNNGTSDAADGYLTNGTKLMSTVSNMGDYRAIAIRERRIFSQQGYKGYETGGGIASVIGLILSGTITFLRYGGYINILSDEWFETEGAQILTWCLLIVFIMFMIILIGCMIELELRRQNHLYPIGWSYEEMEWFPVYEIIDWSYESIGFYTTANTDDPQGTCAKIAYRWFKIMLGFIAFILKALVVLLVILFRNPPFGLFSIVTVTMGFMYYTHIEKDPKGLDPTLVWCSIALLLSLILIFAVNNGNTCACKCCGKTKDIPTIPESRVEQKTQKKCRIVFIISFILLFLCVALLVITIIDYHETKFDLDEASSVWQKTNCVGYYEARDAKDDDNSGSIIINNDNNGTSTVVTTDDTEAGSSTTNTTKVKNVIGSQYPLCIQFANTVAIVFLLSLVWCILWVSSLIWYFADSLSFNVIMKDQKDVFREFARFKIKRRIYGDLQQNHYQSSWSGAWFMWLFGGSKYKIETVFVSMDTAIKLHKHLLKVTKMLRFNQSVLVNPWLPYILPPTGQPNIAPIGGGYGTAFVAGGSVQTGRSGKNNHS